MADWTKSLERGVDSINTKETGRIECATRNERFWLPKGGDRYIVVLDPSIDELIAVWEHAIKMRDWRNWCTCLCHLDMDCILDGMSDNPKMACSRYKMTPLSIIDTGEYEIKRGPKAGTKVKNQRRLFAAKMPVVERWARRWKTELELAVTKGVEPPKFQYSMWKVFRGNGDQSPNTGDEFTFIKNVDPAALPICEPYDYTDLLKPDLELTMKYAKHLRATGSTGGGSLAPERDGDEEMTAASGVEKLPF